MNIIVKKPDNMKRFDELSKGTVFKFKKHYYMKGDEDIEVIREEGMVDVVNAICFTAGSFSSFYPDDMVEEIVNVSLVINDEATNS